MTSNQIGEFLAVLRKSKGFTQQEVAERLGVSNKTVSSWETGSSSPDISMLPVLAELYEVSCDEIVRGKRIPADETEKNAHTKREKALEHILQKQKTDLTILCWIACGLAVLGVLFTLLLGYAVLESLIGFFIGLIFLVCSIVTSAIGLRRIRFSLGAEQMSEKTDEFILSLDKTAFWLICINAAAFGFILPHVMAPVHTGLNAEWIGINLACCAGFFLISVLVGIPVCLHRRKKFLLTSDAEITDPARREAHQKAFRAYMLARWRFKHILLMIFLPIAIAAAIAFGFAIASSSTHVTINADDIQTSSWIYKDLNAILGPFLKDEYTLISEEQPKEETETGKYAVVYLFTEFPKEWEDYYLTKKTKEGTLVTIYKYRAEVENSEEILEFYNYHPELQGGITLLSVEKEISPMYYLITMQISPSLYDQKEQLKQQNLKDALSWCAVGSGAAGILSPCITLPAYFKKKRAFLSA